MGVFTVTLMQSSWNPWHELRERQHLRVHWVSRGRRGCIDFEDNVITLRRSMTYEERRCVVAHELVHDERGPVPLWLEPREERAVRCESSQRLISLDALAEVLSWTAFPAEAAADLGVDAATLQARLVNLTTEERDVLSERLAGVPHVGHTGGQEDD